MTGSNASGFTPLAVGISDSGDFSSYLGRPTQIEDETFIMVQASAAIASGSNGKQLQTAISSGQATFVVALATGGVSAYLNCGAIPWTHTGPIAANAYFPALRNSRGHVLLIRGTATGAMVAAQPVVAGTGADLINVFTGSAIAALTGEAATSSGIGALLDRWSNAAGVTLTADTGVAAVSGWVQYSAPFRGAN